jgi:hypothetical protein
VLAVKRKLHFNFFTHEHWVIIAQSYTVILLGVAVDILWMKTAAFIASGVLIGISLRISGMLGLKEIISIRDKVFGLFNTRRAAYEKN